MPIRTFMSPWDHSALARLAADHEHGRVDPGRRRPARPSRQRAGAIPRICPVPKAPVVRTMSMEHRCGYPGPVPGGQRGQWGRGDKWGRRDQCGHHWIGTGLECEAWAVSSEADLVFVGGKVRTPGHPAGFAEAVAVRGGMIQAVGSDDEIRELTGRRTRVVELDGRLVLPGFGDAHVHPVSGGLESLRCNLVGLRARSQCLDAVAAYCESVPPGAWVIGGGWTMSAFPGELPVAADLDAVTDGRPAFLPSRDHHSAWVNTEALRRAGVDASTPDPVDGRIERDEAGQPAGALHDGAMRLVTRHIPETSEAELLTGLVAGQTHLHSLGITSFQDACVGAAAELGMPDSFGAYQMAADYGFLSSHVVGALWWDRDRGLDQIDDLLARREQAGDGAFRATTVKLMLDGVCETFTAAMSSPYLDRHGHPTDHSGRLFIEPEVLDEAARRLGAAGFQLHFHAIGDRAVSAALDQIAGLLGLGTRIAFGSDWPVSSADPLQEMHVAVNRVLSERLGQPGEPECENPFLPDQAITVDAAVDAFTAGVAWVNHEEDVAGRLLPGMRADVVVLDQDLFAIPPRDIGSTSVVATVAGGTVVYGDR